MVQIYLNGGYLINDEKKKDLKFGLPLGLFLRLGLHFVQQRSPIKRLVKQDLFICLVQQSKFTSQEDSRHRFLVERARIKEEAIRDRKQSLPLR